MVAVDVRRFVLTLALATACATTPAAPPADEAWTIEATIHDGRTGETITREALFDRLAAARVVYVAERHDSPHDHDVQRQVLEALAARSSSIAIGLEMVKRPFQKWLSDYVAGRIDEDTFLERTEWSTRWGFDFAMYRPLFEIARAKGLRAYALNARDEITRTVAREGIDALEEFDREALPDLDLEVAAHRAMVKAIFDRHDMGSMAFEDFYTAQVIWDETMGYEVAGALVGDGAPEQLVVFAGSGHIRYGFGIPDRAAKRGATPHVTVLPILEDEETSVEALVDEGAADYLWIMRAVKAPPAPPPRDRSGS